MIGILTLFLFVNFFLGMSVLFLIERNKLLEFRVKETLRSLDIVRISQGKR